ncbi:hypothetical protein [Pseudoclavibacter terrae]|uniref:Uncharacterized protein n=1 Tax=Pseudoclavibacter terrae TaxID=1530195 RepID=A0A7J5B2Y1_9MICO|nr:hypothetical protein [Pseudoclavibacter terrae]KAB1637846.1 hypothetical protein F8O03_11715 [Pseudoclavibacter terrae]
MSDYRTQITGLLPTADGRIPQWNVPDPLTDGGFVPFDGRTLRGPERHEVLLQAFAADRVPELRQWPDTEEAVETGRRVLGLAAAQLRVKPPESIVEWHFEDAPTGDAVNRLFVDAGLTGIDVRYTPAVVGE